MGVEQRQPQFDRVATGRRRKLVEEGLGRHRSVGRAYRAPPKHRHGVVGRRVQFDLQIRNRVGQVGGAFDRHLVDAVLDQHFLERRAHQDRLAHQPVAPADDIAVGIDAAAQRVVEHRPVVPCLHVVLAQPYQLDRCPPADRLDDLGTFQHVVRILAGATPEAAAGVEHVDGHLFGRQAEHCGQRELVASVHLLAVPHLATVRTEANDAVHRLHRRVGQVGEVVAGLKHPGGTAQGRFGVAVGSGREARRRRLRPIVREDLVRALAVGLAVVPRHCQRIAPLLRGPGVPRQHRHPLRDRDDVVDTGDRLGRCRVERRHGRTEARRVGDHGDQHAGQVYILGERRAAGGLFGRILARNALADQLEFVRLLQSDLVRHRLPCGRFGQFTEARRTL